MYTLLVQVVFMNFGYTGYFRQSTKAGRLKASACRENSYAGQFRWEHKAQGTALLIFLHGPRHVVCGYRHDLAPLQT